MGKEVPYNALLWSPRPPEPVLTGLCLRLFQIHQLNYLETEVEVLLLKLSARRPFKCSQRRGVKFFTLNKLFCLKISLVPFTEHADGVDCLCILEWLRF
jgi:hypothetical protein